MNRLNRLATKVAMLNDLVPDLLELMYGKRRIRYASQIDREEREQRKAERLMPLTVEEQATLETLHGKAKKSYVKELKAKYEMA
jgi:hypothetical protein